MATTLYMSAISLIIQYFQNLGLMAAGGQVFTYVGGSAGTPVTTYTDSTGIVANPNPLTLNSVGRPTSASGAPVAFWVPGGTVVQLLVNDANGNRLVFLDNIPSLNDFTSANSSLAALLASAASSNVSGVGPVAGVDLVANAVKSYDVFADVRVANEPQLVTGQTLNIEVQGGLSVNDALGGNFYWNPASTAADDNRTVLRPASVASASPGRWLRYYGLGQPQIILKPSSQQVVSSTVLANDTALVVNLLASATYLVQLRAQLLGISGTGQGYKVGVSYNGTIANNAGGAGVVSSGGAGSAVYNSIAASPGPITEAAISDTFATPDVVNLDFIISTGNAGAVQVQFAQNSSSANATQMNAGSALIVTRLA